jgi:uncharacterized repeat protein (TIGR03847 family)
MSMEPVVHVFDPPDRFVAGTVGPPGQRTFFLQARAGRQIVTVSLEKQQVTVLAARIDGLLDDLMEKAATRTIIPAVAPLDLADDEPLEQPIEEEFRAGTMTLSWDGDDERVVIEVFPFDDTVGIDEETGIALPEPEPDEVFLVRLPAGAARAFVERSARVVRAGRPDCPFCGSPIDASGHLCVRANGFKRRA